MSAKNQLLYKIAKMVARNKLLCHRVETIVARADNLSWHIVEIIVLNQLIAHHLRNRPQNIQSRIRQKVGFLKEKLSVQGSHDSYEK